jgi:hypothetical protein
MADIFEESKLCLGAYPLCCGSYDRRCGFLLEGPEVSFGQLCQRGFQLGFGLLRNSPCKTAALLSPDDHISHCGRAHD